MNHIVPIFPSQLKGNFHIANVKRKNTFSLPMVKQRSPDLIKVLLEHEEYSQHAIISLKERHHLKI